MLKRSLFLMAVSMVFSQITLANSPTQDTNIHNVLRYAHSNDGRHEYKALINEKSLVKKASVSYFDIVAHFLEDDANTKENNNKKIESDIIISTVFDCKTDTLISYKFRYVNNQTKTTIDLPLSPETLATPITAEEKEDMAILKQTVCD